VPPVLLSHITLRIYPTISTKKTAKQLNKTSINIIFFSQVINKILINYVIHTFGLLSFAAQYDKYNSKNNDDTTTDDADDYNGLFGKIFCS